MKIRALTSACPLQKWLGCFWLARTPTRLDTFQASAPLDEVDSSGFLGPSLGQKEMFCLEVVSDLGPQSVLSLGRHPALATPKCELS